VKSLNLNHLDINIMWRLVINGKFQKCIKDFDVIGNKYVNRIIEQILTLYLDEINQDKSNLNWDIRDIYIEDTDNFSIIEQTIKRVDDTYMNIDEKINFIKDIVYPYKIKDKTIEKYINIKWGQCLPKNWIDDNIPKDCK